MKGLIIFIYVMVLLAAVFVALRVFGWLRAHHSRRHPQRLQ